jgi:RNA 2',3'-cyclic 3'-phosphodiesterase
VRLFVALEIPEEIRAAIAAFGRELKPLDDSWKWTRAENLHVTLKFLGEIPSGKLESVRQALRGVPGEWPIEVKFSGLGFFPNERRPRVLWVGMKAPQSLPALAAAIDTSLAKVGLAKEERELTPHLTLARSKAERIAPELREVLAKYSTREFGMTNASAFHLVESKLKSTGPEYTTLESFPGARDL